MPTSTERRWRDVPVRGKGLLVVAVPSVGLLFVVAAFVLVDRERDRAADAVAHTLEVQSHLHLVLTSVLDAETGVRGFTITADEEYLAPFELARAAMPGHLERLRLLVADNPVQAARAVVLSDLAMDRLAAAQSIREDNASQPPSPSLLAQLDRSQLMTDDLRARIDEMTATEQRLLEDRRDDEEQATRRGVITALVSVLVGLGGGVLAMLLFSSGVTRRLAGLGRDAELMAAGRPADDDTPPDDSADELGDLGRSLARARVLLAGREGELREREAYLQAVLDSSPDVVLVFDREANVVSTSSAIVQMLGYSGAQRTGRPAADVVHPEDVDRFSEAIRRVADGDDVALAERYRVRHHDGSWVYVEARGRALPVRNDHEVHVLIASRDISSQVQLEHAQTKARDAAEEANRAKSEFLSRMSHELRTPLNAVLGFAQLLEMDQLDADQRRSVGHILKGGHHLLGLIDEVLDIARIDAGQIALSPEPVDLGEVLAETLDLIEPLAAARRIELVSDRAGEREHFVLADRQRLKQVLLNLLSNAIKYNREGGSVAVTYRSAESRVELSVTDTGRGVPSQHRDLLFTPFERLGADRTGVEGTGIGLALSRRLAEAMGGSLALRSTSSAGSTFELHLPSAEGPMERLERLGSVPTSGPAAGTSRPDGHFETGASAGAATHTVLHIEDNLANVRLVEHVLARRPNVRVVAAMQGRLGLDLMRDLKPDLVLLDLHLPDLDGETILRQLSEDPETASIPVVVVSADATPGQIQRLLAAGAFDYLTKPIDVRRLIHLIDAALGD